MEFFQTKNVCSKKIGITVENKILKEVKFFGCCDGDSKAFEILLKDMPIEKIIKDLSDIQCGDRGTSCMQELCKILKKFYKI